MDRDKTGSSAGDKTGSFAGDKTGGFTLVEMIAVIGILSILLAAVVPEISSYIDAARAAAARAEAQIAADAVQMFLDERLEEGRLTARDLHVLMGTELEDSDGILSAYLSGGQEEARIFSVNADLDTGRLKELVYETKYHKIKLLIAEDGTRTITELEKEAEAENGG